MLGRIYHGFTTLFLSFPLTLCCATAKSVPVGLRNTESVTLVFPKLPVLVVSLGVNSAR